MATKPVSLPNPIQIPAFSKFLKWDLDLDFLQNDENIIYRLQIPNSSSSRGFTSGV